MPSLAERYRAQLARTNPDAARQIAEAQAEVANAVDAPNLRITDISEVKDVLRTYLDAYLDDTSTITGNIDDARKKSQQPVELRVIDLGRVAHLQNTMDEEGVQRLIRNALHGPDGNGGLAATLAFKFGGTWRLVAYEFETYLATSTSTSYIPDTAGGSESVSHQRAARVPETLNLVTEWLEITGTPRLRYDQNGRLAGDPQVVQAAMSPEAIEAQQQLAEALKLLAAQQQAAAAAIPVVRVGRPPKAEDSVAVGRPPKAEEQGAVGRPPKAEEPVATGRTPKADE